VTGNGQLPGPSTNTRLASDVYVDSEQVNLQMYDAFAFDLMSSRTAR